MIRHRQEYVIIVFVVKFRSFSTKVIIADSVYIIEMSKYMNNERVSKTHLNMYDASRSDMKLSSYSRNCDSGHPWLQKYRRTCFMSEGVS